MIYEIYDIKDTSVLVEETVLKNLISRVSYIKGFKVCSHTDIVTNVDAINRSANMSFVKNSETLFQLLNDHGEYDTVILVEGEQNDNTMYFERVYKDSIMKFDSYSEYAIEELKNIKYELWTTILYKQEYLDNWIKINNLSFKEMSYTKFEEYVMNSKDYESYIDSLDIEVLEEYQLELKNRIGIFLKKYQDEIITHYRRIIEECEEIDLKNPVISNIYMLNSFVRDTNKLFPRLKIVSINKKNLSLLGVTL